MTEKDIIKHIVCSGGGVTGFKYYGVLRELNKKGIWCYENIETIYGCSIGALIAVVISLNYEWDILDDYFIKRPWQNVFKMSVKTVLNSYNKKGLYDSNTFNEILIPLLKGNDISVDVTLKELYELNKKEIHLFSLEMNSFKIVDISYKTHPDWKVLDAVYSSCALPVMLAPFFKDDECYCDGAMANNYPLDYCILNVSNKNEILGLKGENPNKNTDKITADYSIYSYIVFLAKKILNCNKIIKEEIENIGLEVLIPLNVNIQSFRNALLNEEDRIKLIQEGKEIAETFLESFNERDLLTSTGEEITESEENKTEQDMFFLI